MAADGGGGDATLDTVLEVLRDVRGGQEELLRRIGAMEMRISEMEVRAVDQQAFASTSSVRGELRERSLGRHSNGAGLRRRRVDSELAASLGGDIAARQLRDQFLHSLQLPDNFTEGPLCRNAIQGRSVNDAETIDLPNTAANSDAEDESELSVRRGAAAAAATRPNDAPSASVADEEEPLLPKPSGRPAASRDAPQAPPKRSPTVGEGNVIRSYAPRAKHVPKPFRMTPDGTNSSHHPMSPTRQSTGVAGAAYTAAEVNAKVEVDKSIRNTIWRITHGLPINVECRLVWQMDVLFLLTGVVMATLTIAFWHPDLLGGQTDDAPGWFVATVLLTELFTLVWMFVRCSVRVRDGEWDLIEDLGEIRRRYFRSWFLVDMIYAAPIEFFFLHWANRWFYGMLFRHLLRYFRGLSIGASINPLLSGRRKGFGFVSYCCTLILGVHVVACVFWAMAEEECNDYATALYWATATVTGTGYGDITADTQLTRVYAVLSMIVGIVTVSTFTAFATRYLTHRNPIVTEKEKQKETMHIMMKHYNVRWETQLQVMRCFGSVLNRHDERQFKSITEDLPPALKEELIVYFNAHQLRRAPLFARVHDKALLVALASHMRHAFMAPFEYVFHQGDPACELFFIISGVVEIIVTFPGREDEEIVVSTLRQQECFGEGALLYDDHRRTASAQAKAPCEFIVLSAADFKLVMAEFNEPSLIAAMRHQDELRRVRVPSTQAAIQQQQVLQLPKQAQAKDAGVQ